MSTHGLARILENICAALREFPDQKLSTLLQKLRGVDKEPKRARTARPARTVSAPPCNPRMMERSALKAYLQSPKHFPYKADLLEFARRYEVPVNARTPREEIVRLSLRMIHDIPRGFTILRFLADPRDPLPSANLDLPSTSRPLPPSSITLH